MKKILVTLLLGIFLLGFAMASNGNSGSIANQGNSQENEVGNLSSTTLQERIQTNNNIRERMQNGEEKIIPGNGLILRKLNAERMELKLNGSKVETRLELSNEGNSSELKVRLNNGRNAEIKIMPDTASARALERLRLKNCNETRNCTIELKEVGEGNQSRLTYEVKAEKTFRFLGLFKNRQEVSVQIDAETGEEIATKRPWWAWMSSEDSEE